MRNRLLSLPALARDLGLAILIAGHIWDGMWSFLTLVTALALLGAGLWARASSMMATAAATHAKAVSTEARLNAYIAQTNTTLDSHDNRINNTLPATGGTVSGDLHVSGTLYGISGGLTVGDVIRAVGGLDSGTALVNFINKSQGGYLASLSKAPVPRAVSAAPSSYSQSWGQNITGVLNDIKAFVGQFGAW